METNPVIIANDLARRFGDTVAVHHLTLEVYAGEVFGFLGHNSAGKTTTVRLLNGVLAPNGGTARVLGLDPWPTARPCVGVPDAKVARHVEELLTTFELADRADEPVGGYWRWRSCAPHQESFHMIA